MNFKLILYVMKTDNSYFYVYSSCSMTCSYDTIFESVKTTKYISQVEWSKIVHIISKGVDISPLVKEDFFTPSLNSVVQLIVSMNIAITDSPRGLSPPFDKKKIRNYTLCINNELVLQNCWISPYIFLSIPLGADNRIDTLWADPPNR